jgi:arginine N-succinyltransferase
MAVPHPSGRAAMRMLEDEGFEGGEYVDIFDGGPTMSVDTDDIRTIRESRERALLGASEEGERKMVAAGHLKDFAACYGKVGRADDGATLDEKAAEMLGLEQGDSFLAIGR